MRRTGIALIVLLAGLRAGAAEGLPTRDPVAWQKEPHARTSSGVTMAAEPLGPAGTVEYLFDCVKGPGRDSGWQASPSYADKGLEPLAACTYVAKARDRRRRKEIAPPSRPVEVTTRRAADHANVKHGMIDRDLSSGKLEMIPLSITGDKDNRINIVVINRWAKGQRNAYNKPELRDEFIKDARHVVRAFTAGDEKAIAPYPDYRGFFNIYAVWWPGIPPWNPQDRKGGMHWVDYNEIRARLFLPWQIEGKGWVTHLAMFNGSGGGGGAGLREGPRVGDAMIVGNKITSFIHEFNHTAPGIPDEYTSSGMWGRGGEGSTTTNDYRRASVKWRAWVDADTPVPTPYSKKYHDVLGVFGGGVHRMAHLFRPTARGCIMGAGSFAGNAKQLCVVCRQRAVQRYYRWVDAIEKRTPARKEIALPRPGKIRFAVERVRPEPDTQKTEWRLNGKVIATGRDEVEVAFGALAEYELVFSLTDESTFVRHDPPHARYPRAETRWKITNGAPSSTAAPLSVTLKGRAPVFKGASDGAIEVTVAGGRPPYTYLWSDGSSEKSRRGLDVGTYALTVVDSEFRKADARATLKREGQLSPELRAERIGRRWRLTVEGAQGGDVTCRWSNGSPGRSLASVRDGRYTCVVRHRTGSSVTRQVSLSSPARALAVSVGRVVPSSGGENNGSARLQVRGGRPPYRFAWSDGVETGAPTRHFLAPGRYTVAVWDANRCRVVVNVATGGEPGFAVGGLRFEKSGTRTVRIANPQRGLRYLWYAGDRPAYLPRFPHGIYTGTFAASDGRTCKAEAFVIQNKGGMYVGVREKKNNFGHWIHLMAWLGGPKAAPMIVAVNTRQKGRLAKELRVEGHRHGETTWKGNVADGRLRLEGTGPEGGRFDLLFASHPPEADEPLREGLTFSPPGAGNYYVAAQKVDSGAISPGRVGVAVTMGAAPERRTPLAPDKVRGAKLLLWLDASDMDGDGKEDDPPPRRGAVLGWQGKAGGVNFKDFVYYRPNVQNGKGVGGWDTIWIQNLGTAVKGYRTIFMVRREHDYSSAGTAPWRDLNDLIGVGEYGKRLFAEKASKAFGEGAVYVNGAKVDPRTAAMPEGFYQATYEFAKKIGRAFRTTDGHWEGAVAECLVYDSKLSEAERKGVEEYLRRKWISAVHLAGR